MITNGSLICKATVSTHRSILRSKERRGEKKREAKRINETLSWKFDNRYENDMAQGGCVL